MAVKIVIADRVTGKFVKMSLTEDKLCPGYQWETFLMGETRRCYPITPNRYATLLRILKPMPDGLFGTGYILPDTVRVVARVVVLFSPMSFDIAESLYDIRTDTEGLIIEDKFYPVEWNPAMSCKEGLVTICATVGPLIRVGDKLKHIPIMLENEYREYIRAIATKSKDVKPWEVVLAKLYLYENFINQLIEESAKYGELRLAEYINHLAAQFRRVLETTESVKAITEKKERER